MQRFLLLIFLCACEPVVEYHGYSPDDLDITKLEVGKDDTETVRVKYGTPLLVSTFPQKDNKIAWYYTFKRMVRYSYHLPDTTDQCTLIILFDKKGKVADKQVVLGENPIVTSNKETDIKGYDRGLMKDIFGNFGRYLNKHIEEKKDKQ